jgi:hypothetical protein
VAGITPTPSVAALLLSCILSDSLEFRSPTTTPRDVQLANELAPLAQLDAAAHAAAMFAAKADIGHLSPAEVTPRGRGRLCAEPASVAFVALLTCSYLRTSCHLLPSLPPPPSPSTLPCPDCALRW